MKLLRQDVLIKLIISHYKAEEINTAKDALFGCFPEEKRPSNLRKKIRQGAQKLESNINPFMPSILYVGHLLKLKLRFAHPIYEGR